MRHRPTHNHHLGVRRACISHLRRPRLAVQTADSTSVLALRSRDPDLLDVIV
jgi:hypothetical protein